MWYVVCMYVVVDWESREGRGRLLFSASTVLHPDLNQRLLCLLCLLYILCSSISDQHRKICMDLEMYTAHHHHQIYLPTYQHAYRTRYVQYIPQLRTDVCSSSRADSMACQLVIYQAIDCPAPGNLSAVVYGIVAQEHEVGWPLPLVSQAMRLE